MKKETEEERSPEQETAGDLELEAVDESGDEATIQAKLKKMREELASAKAERQEYLDGWQRCKADAINMRKDTEASAKRTAELLREALVHDIIPALDSFDMASQSEAWGSVADGFRSGMEAVQSQLLSALRSHSIERYCKVGDTFDHALHDAIEERDDIAGKSGEILRILRYGYKSGDRIIRPAQVMVKK